MNKAIKYGSIDIGSNAIRLLISTAHYSSEGVFFKKNSLIRVPIRLGQDVFIKGKIGAKNQKRMIQAMIAYRNLMDAHGVEDYLACATSAMRDAENSKQLLKEIKQKANINIEIIGFEYILKLIDYTNRLYIHFKLNSWLEVVVFCSILFLLVYINIKRQWKWGKLLVILILFLSVLNSVFEFKLNKMEEIIVWNTNDEQAVTRKFRDTIYYYSSYHLPINQRIINYSKSVKAIIKRKRCPSSDIKEISNLYPIKLTEQDTIACVLFKENTELKLYFKSIYPDKHLKFMLFKGGSVRNRRNEFYRLDYGPSYIPNHYDVFFYP